MTLGFLGLMLGTFAGVGVLSLLGWALDGKRHRLATRVLPYVGGLVTDRRPQLRGRLLAGVAARLDRLLGGATSVRRRLERAGLEATVADFRVEQAVWGLCAFACAATFAVLVSLHAPGRVVPMLVLCAVAFLFGALARDNRLSAQVAARERRLFAEFPAVAELLALSVAAGESPVSAMERVAERGHGAMAAELRRVVGGVRTGVPVAVALDELGRRSGLPVVSRFAEGVAVAIERGTPLADVLHAQAGDVREAQRRVLIEGGARREVFMLTPVVFLVLPTVVLFAFYPGLVGLHLVAS